MSLDDLLESIREDEFISPKAAAGHKKKIKAEKFFNLAQELRGEGTLGGKVLTPQQRKAGFKAARGGADSVDWKNFLNQVEDTKAASEGITSNTKMLPAGKSVLEEISTDVKSILGIIDARTEAEEDAADELKQEDEKDKRKQKEEDKEKDAKKGMKIPGFIKTAAKPITDIWSSIVKTFGILLAGWGIDKMFKWLGDPKNKKSVEELKDFITVALPPILKGILALTALDIGIKVVKFTAMLVKGTATMIKGLWNLSKSIIAWAKANPLLAGTIGLAALIGYAMTQGQNPEIPEDDSKGKDEDLKLFKSEGGGEDKKVKMKGGGLVPQLNVLQKFNEGGLVQNFNQGGLVQNFNQGDNNMMMGNMMMGDMMMGDVMMNNNMMMGDNMANNNMTISQPKKENNIFNFLNPLSWIGGQAQDAIGQADRGEGQFDGGGLAARLLEKRRALSEAQGFNQGGLVPQLNVLQNFNQGGIVQPKKFNTGGKVPGAGNKDTVPAMLTPGEFVMSKGAVEKYGTSTLASMNAIGGGNNTPEIVGTVKGFNQGGVVGKASGIKNTAKKLFNSVPDGGTPNVSILPVPSRASGGVSGGEGGSDGSDVALFSPINHEDMQTLIVKNMYSILD